MTLQSINPYTGEIIGEFAAMDDPAIEKNIQKAQNAFHNWKKTTFNERNSWMTKAGEVLTRDVESLAGTISREMGKTIREARAEITKCAWACRYYAANAETFLKTEEVNTEAYRSYITYEPLGIILGIMPWNFPFWQVFRFAVPTLMAGNVALLKHSSNVQMCARAIENVFLKAGFPAGVFQNLAISSQNIKPVIQDERIRGISLTGSEPAGKSVAGLAGRNLKTSVLELGGSNAFVVLEDANIEQAVNIGVTARMQNAGQSCIAAKRFIVVKNIAQQFTELLTAKISKLVTGDPFDEKTDLGPLSGIQQAMAVEAQVQNSIKMGAQILTGGIRKDALFSPAVLTGVAPGMPVFDEEVFGPVAPVIVAENTEDAIRLSNLSAFGLGASLFTNNLEKAQQLVPLFDEGAVFINALVKSDPRLPFGGIKHSGYGRELGVHGIREFINVKTVYVDRGE